MGGTLLAIRAVRRPRFTGTGGDKRVARPGRSSFRTPAIQSNERLRDVCPGPAAQAKSAKPCHLAQQVGPRPAMIASFGNSTLVSRVKFPKLAITKPADGQLRPRGHTKTTMRNRLITSSSGPCGSDLGVPWGRPQCHVVQRDRLGGVWRGWLARMRLRLATVGVGLAAKPQAGVVSGRTWGAQVALSDAWAPQVTNAPTADPAHQPHLGSPSGHR